MDNDERRRNCSDLMCPSYSQPVITGLTRNPETFATSTGPHHCHIWIPAFAGMTGCGWGTSFENHHGDARCGIQPIRVLESEQQRSQGAVIHKTLGTGARDEAAFRMWVFGMKNPSWRAESRALFWVIRSYMEDISRPDPPGNAYLRMAHVGVSRPSINSSRAEMKLL